MLPKKPKGGADNEEKGSRTGGGTAQTAEDQSIKRHTGCSSIQYCVTKLPHTVTSHLLRRKQKKNTSHIAVPLILLTHMFSLFSVE
jgi:hypothetical protein